MPRPAFLKKGTPAAAPTTGLRRDMLEQHMSPSNRQNVPFEAPVAAYMRAKARIQDRHDAARKEQQTAGIQVSKVDTFDRAKWEEEMADFRAVHHYEHHVTNMRGANTQKRENVVVRKP